MQKTRCYGVVLGILCCLLHSTILPVSADAVHGVSSDAAPPQSTEQEPQDDVMTWYVDANANTEQESPQPPPLAQSKQEQAEREARLAHMEHELNALMAEMDTTGLSSDEILEKLQHFLHPPSSADAMAAVDYDSSQTDALPVPSEAYLAIEDQFIADGLTLEVVQGFMALVESEANVFAQERLAFIELFEPNGRQLIAQVTGVAPPSIKEWNITTAFDRLRTAADAQLASATGLLALLNLIDFGTVRDPAARVSRQERHDAAHEMLMQLAEDQVDYLATLAVGYRMWIGALTHDRNKRLTLGFRDDDRCEQALMYYHRCAESNVHEIAALGGEKAAPAVRLSDEWISSGMSLNDFFSDGGILGTSDGTQEEAIHRFEYLRTIAAQGALGAEDFQYVEATEQLAEMYFFGDEAAGVPRDQTLAAQYYQQAADAGEPLAQANYAMMRLGGIGIPQDNQTAFEYFSRAAAQGNGFAMHGLGVMYLKGAEGVLEPNATKSVEYFEQAVAHGYLEAHTFLGSAYLNGHGVKEINMTRAFQHFEIAAEESQSSQAQFNLGVMHFQGYGTEPSCPKALECFRTVALQPDLLADTMPFSMAKAYECYQQGDYVRAFLQYRLLSEIGSQTAQVNAAFLLEHHGHLIMNSSYWMTDEPEAPSGQTAARKKALDLYQQAAQLMNDTEAMRKIGVCHHEPWTGVCPQNDTIAMQHYAQAATLGDAEAAYNCGWMHLMGGSGVARDLEAAKSYYAQCSDAPFPDNVPCQIMMTALEMLALVRGWTGR